MKNSFLCMGYECKKFLRVQRGWLILAACVCVQVLLCVFADAELYRYAFSVQNYKNYVKKYGGEIREERREEIAAELERQSALANAVWDGEDAYSEEAALFQRKKQLASEKLPVLAAVYQRYVRLGEVRQDRAELVYDLEFASYAKKFQVDWAAVFFVAVLSVCCFAGDFRCGMEQLLFPSKLGRQKIYAGKAITVTVFAGAAAAVFYAIPLLVLGKRWELGALSAPIQSYSGFEECTLSLRMRDALILAGVLKILATMVLALLLAFFTRRFRNEILAVAVTAAFVGCGAVAGGREKAAALFLLAPLRGIALFSALTPGMLLAELVVLLLELVILLLLHGRFTTCA